MPGIRAKLVAAIDTLTTQPSKGVKRKCDDDDDALTIFRHLLTNEDDEDEDGEDDDNNNNNNEGKNEDENENSDDKMRWVGHWIDKPLVKEAANPKTDVLDGENLK